MQPRLAEAVGQHFVVAFDVVREAEEQAVRAFEHRARPEKALARDARRVQPALRRPARVQALGPGALGEVLDDAARHAAGDAERVHRLLSVEPQRFRDRERRRHRPQHRGRMKPRLVDRLGATRLSRHMRFDARRDAEQRGAAVAAEALAGGEHRRHDHGARMHRPALEGVVEILAVRGGAVEQRRVFRR